MMSFDLAGLPRAWIAALMFFVGGFLLLAWLGRIVPPPSSVTCI
jgi:hypothetical protein